MVIETRRIPAGTRPGFVVRNFDLLVVMAGKDLALRNEFL